MGGHRLSHRYWISVLLFLLLPLGFFGSAQQMMDLPLEDHGSEHHSRHHSLLGPCLDRGNFKGELGNGHFFLPKKKKNGLHTKVYPFG
jgi:hypothetical protein